MTTALNLAKEAAGIAADQAVELVIYPKPRGLLSLLLERLGLQANLGASLPVHVPDAWRDVFHRLTPFIASGPGPRLVMPVVLRIR
jgi:hypothetical protein